MSKKILIIDDNESERFLIHRTLLKIGIDDQYIHEAKDGEQGYDMIKNNDYTVILLDINMPRMSGLEVLNKVKEELDTPPPYIIILTTSQQESDLGNAITGGADAFAVKPNQPSKIKVILNAVKLIFINKSIMNLELRKFFSYVNLQDNEKILI